VPSKARKMRGVRFVVLLGVMACAHVPRPSGDLPASVPALPRATATDSAVYDAVLRFFSQEYGQPGDVMRVHSSTMDLCDLAARVTRLDCIRETTFIPMESRWARGTWAFEALISASIRGELAASFRANNSGPQLLATLPQPGFLSGTDMQTPQQISALTAGRYAGDIVVARAGYSSNGYSYAYGVFSRQRFACGIVFLLRNEGGSWRIVAHEGVWVT
jgi:hypothetical protein